MPNSPVPFVATTLLAVSIMATAWLSLAPVPGKPIAAVFPPWWTPAQTFGAAARAGGDVVRFGGLPGILVTAAGTPDLAGRLRSVGAWILLDAQALGGCTSNP